METLMRAWSVTCLVGMFVLSVMAAVTHDYAGAFTLIALTAILGGMYVRLLRQGREEHEREHATDE